MGYILVEKLGQLESVNSLAVRTKCSYKVTMSTQNKVKKRMGRPSVDSEQITVRIQRPMLDAVDAWIEQQPDPKPNRPEAIRRILKFSLNSAD